MSIDAGHSPDLEDTPASPGQWGVLKVSAVGEDGFRPEENKVVHYQHSIRLLIIPVGSPEDLKRVVEIDSLHEAQVSALRREVEGLRLLKRGLMDDLLMGRVRVPVG